MAVKEKKETPSLSWSPVCSRISGPVLTPSKSDRMPYFTQSERLPGTYNAPLPLPCMIRYPSSTSSRSRTLKDKGYDLNFEDQYVIKLRGKDADGNNRAVEFTLEGKPLLTLWREDGKTIRGYPSDYMKKFNLKINPLQFNDAQPPKKESETPQEAVKKKPISPEPTPAIEPYTRPPSIKEQIAQNRAAKAACEQQEKQQKQRQLFYIGLAILTVIGIVVAIYLLRRLHQK